ncbi:hypothetical protein FEM03_00310 [Phragmitibacter flavus]|uniref:Uncharacterized protein n=1 Tax=Phragmitibacter flavus TaxID=2576071 RepID=A0A5R8KJQ5_9BACT|nr:hypothetical protein [Phragmitibacter flavus]TLD72553.1 hypothetical protein FEM03_00310 [Phragmitibacter flavus]
MKLRLTILVLLSLVVWKLFRADWIVECESASADFHPPVSVERFTDSFTPPVSAYWNPPTPTQLTGRASSSWTDQEFFASGGSYGPTSEPFLRVNWQLSLAKIAGVFVLIWVCFRVFVPSRKQQLNTAD